MESSVADHFAKKTETLADKAADKGQSGIRSAQDSAKDAGSSLSNKVDGLRSEAGPALAKASGRVQSAGKQGWDAITDSASQAWDVASNATGSIVSYTKERPARALAIAAAAGALLYAVIKALMPSRD